MPRYEAHRSHPLPGRRRSPAHLRPAARAGGLLPPVQPDRHRPRPFLLGTTSVSIRMGVCHHARRTNRRFARRFQHSVQRGLAGADRKKRPVRLAVELAANTAPGRAATRPASASRLADALQPAAERIRLPAPCGTWCRTPTAMTRARRRQERTASTRFRRIPSIRCPHGDGLWTANVLSTTGGYINDVGAAWLMTSLSTSPLLVSLIQVVSNAPFSCTPAGRTWRHSRQRPAGHRDR